MQTCPFCGGKSDDCLYCAAEKRKDEARQMREEEQRQMDLPPPPPSPMASFSRPLHEPPPPSSQKRGMGTIAVVGLTVLGYLFFSVLALVILPIDAALAVLCIAYLVIPPAAGLIVLWRRARRLNDFVKVLLSFLLGAVILFGILMAVLGPGG